MRIVFLNTTILTTDGKFELTTVDINEARKIAQGSTAAIPSDIGNLPAEMQLEVMQGLKPSLSAIGHESTAQIMSELLDVQIDVNRIQYKQEPGDVCICFKMNGRPAEGKILTREEIEAMGFEFKVLRMI